MKSRALLLVFALVVAACGGDDDTAGDTAVTVAGTTEPATDEPATEGGEFSGDPSSAWCVAARDIEASTDELDALDFSDPTAVEEAFRTIVGKIEAVADDAPEEIRDDVRTSLDSFKAIDEALADVDYNFFDLDLTVLEDLNTEAEAAGDRIERYNADVCGIEPSTTDDTGDGGDDAGDDGFDPGAGTIREQALAELLAVGFTEDEANCIFDNFDFSSGNPVADPTALAAIFETCGIDPARLAELGG
jgi:hypothetical protein